ALTVAPIASVPVPPPAAMAPAAPTTVNATIQPPPAATALPTTSATTSLVPVTPPDAPAAGPSSNTSMEVVDGSDNGNVPILSH
ncbi:hypothetical protein H0H87_010283, partial [Tephrocybe sp. NHM501043]